MGEQRLIDANALFTAFENAKWYDNNDRDLVAEDILMDAPTIEAVPVVRGKWICNPDESKFSLVCSVCGKVMPCVPEYLPDTPPFCNCGARMDGAT